MSLTSTLFFFFMAICILLYYCTPIQYRWIVLLCASLLFYWSYTPTGLIYVFISSITVYFATRAMERKTQGEKTRKRILVLALFITLGLLGYTKYIVYISGVLGIGRDFGTSIIIPIGISFYTFQIVGYLLDVYWGKDVPEKNYLKLLLFTIYFPQIIQGPISKHKDLSIYFENGTKYDFLNIKYGIQLVIWGVFKKIVIADTLAIAANEVLHNPVIYSGITVVFGLFAYSAQLYADFSGGIDVIRGCSECLGIRLVENFQRPYFSQSMQEFWQRWHITLGTWMKDYVFYPMALSKSMSKLGKKSQKLLGKKTGRKIPICVENIVVFLIVGIWHGPYMHFVAFGLYNGLVISISTLLDPIYDRMYAITHINRNAFTMRIVRIIRTFLLVNIGRCFDNVYSIKDSFLLIQNIFKPNNTFYDGVLYLGLFKYQYAYVTIGLIIVFIVSVMQEKGIEVRRRIDTLPYIVKMTIWLVFISLIPLMGWDPSAASGFMYANF